MVLSNFTISLPKYHSIVDLGHSSSYSKSKELLCLYFTIKSILRQRKGFKYYISPALYNTIKELMSNANL